jgi:hypothetical protein
MTITRRRLGLRLAAGVVGAAAFGGWARAADDDDAPPNIFISPCGQPFRAQPEAPYAVVDWFKQADKNSDGRIDHAEFLADAEAFFKQLDLDHDGVLSSVEVALYERRVAPEILGYTFKVGEAPARIWRVQMGGGGGMGGGGMGGGMGGVPMTEGEGEPDTTRPKQPLDESGQGASPYGFFDEPEPVATADMDFDNVIKLPNFLKLADQHFQTLDADGRGYLTLDHLPKTAAQDKLDAWKRHHHKRS